MRTLRNLLWETIDSNSNTISHNLPVAGAESARTGDAPHLFSGEGRIWGGCADIGAARPGSDCEGGKRKQKRVGTADERRYTQMGKEVTGAGAVQYPLSSVIPAKAGIHVFCR